MLRVSNRIALGAVVLGCVLAVPQIGSAQDNVQIIALTHNQASDPFWSIVENGMTEAHKESVSALDCRAPRTSDMVQVAQIIGAAVNQKPAGIVYQDLAMIALMSVTRNFFMGQEPTTGFGPFKRKDMGQADRITRKERRRIGIDVREPQQAVGTFTKGEITMDEPQSPLAGGKEFQYMSAELGGKV